jgi:hypothetical protein
MLVWHEYWHTDVNSPRKEDNIMKKSLLIILLAGLIFNAEASHLASELNLRIHDQSLFVASLDQFHFETPSKVHRFTQVGPGRHHLYVAKVRFNRWGQIIAKDVVFNGPIEIPHNSRVNAVVNRFNNFRIRKVFALLPTAPVVPVYNPYIQNGNATCGPMVMSDQDFRMLVHALECSSFDRTRLNIALEALRHNYVTTSQVAILMALMTFESTKLTLAKKAYHKTVDKHIYFALYDQFTFDSSINELSNFIGRG